MLVTAVPWLDGNRAASVAPRKVMPNGLLLFFVRAMVGVVQRELLERRKVTLDAIEPGGPRGGPVEPDPLRGRIGLHFRLQMVAGVIQHDVQPELWRILSADPLQEGQEGLPVLSSNEATHQGIPLQVVHAEKMLDAAGSMIRGPQAVHVSDPGVMPTVPRLEVQRAEFVHGQADAVPGSVGVQTPQYLGVLSAVFFKWQTREEKAGQNQVV